MSDRQERVGQRSRDTGINSTVFSLHLQGVPMNLIQYALLAAGSYGMHQAMKLHPTNEFEHVRMLRAGYEEARRQEKEGVLYGPPDDEPHRELGHSKQVQVRLHAHRQRQSAR
jgi:hypothetical protein